jgi:hypothetical protein
MKKTIKSLIMTAIVAFTVVIGSVENYVPMLDNVVKVYAEDGHKNNEIPNVSMSDGTLNLGGIENAGDKTSIYDTVLAQVRLVVMFISGIGTLLMVAFFIMNFITLGKSQGNPQERQKAVSGLIMTGLATAGLGSVFIVTMLFYGMFNDAGTTSNNTTQTGSITPRVETYYEA